MGKNLIRLFMTDIVATIRSSFVELIPMAILVALVLFLKSFPDTLLKTFVIMSLPLCFGLMNGGFSIPLFINYADSPEELLEYFSIKYCVLSFFIIVIIIASCAFVESFDSYLTFVGLVTAIPIVLASYFMLFFYFLRTTELEIISGTILFIIATFVYNISYYVFGLIEVWAIPAILLLYWVYFRFLLLLLKSIFVNRFEIIMEKIL